MIQSILYKYLHFVLTQFKGPTRIKIVKQELKQNEVQTFNKLISNINADKKSVIF